MGKNLIIKGADFSANKINGEPIQELTIYLDQGIDSTIGASQANRTNGGWCFLETNNAKLQNKPINYVSFIPSNVGTLNFYKGAKGSAGTLIASCNITSDDIDKIKIFTFDEITLSSSEFFIIGEANSAGGFYYKNSGGDGFYSKAQSSPTVASGALLGFKIGYRF